MDPKERDELFRQGFNMLKSNQPFLAIELFKKRSEKYELFKIDPFPKEYFLPDVEGVAHLKNVKLYSDHWIILEKDKIYRSELSGRNIDWTPIIKNRTSEDGNFFIVNLEEAKSTMHVSEPCLFLGGDENYCHWFLRYLTRLVLIEDFPDLKKLSLIVNEDLHPYQKESLKILEIPEKQLIKIPLGAMVTCEDIFVPAKLREISFHEKGVRWIRQKFLKDQDKVRKKKLYLSRADTDRRKMTNEEEVIALLKEHGFETVIPGRMTLQEQIETFSDASIVVGAHGAGLINMIFAPRNAVLIELSDVLLSYMPDFRILADTVPLNHFELISKNVKTYPNKVPVDYHDFTVDIDEFKEILSQVLVAFDT